MTPRPRPEMLGASGKKVTLKGSSQTAAFAVAPPAGPAKARAMAAGAESAKTYLHIENVVSKKSRATYEVYVNLPEKPDEATYREHYAGTMHLFGVTQASTRSESHSGSGLHFSMDITRLVEKLKDKNAWDDKNIRVTFVPRRAPGTALGTVPEHPPIKVGRVSLYRA